MYLAERLWHGVEMMVDHREKQKINCPARHWDRFGGTSEEPHEPEVVQLTTTEHAYRGVDPNDDRAIQVG